MTTTPRSFSADETVVTAAGAMRDDRIGAVIVQDNDGRPCGILTDRDVVTRVVAAGKRAEETRIGEVCTEDPVVLESSTPIGQAVTTMVEKSVRRVPVVEGSRTVGIVSLGDLARHQDPKSALGSISAAPANG